jgi:tetratricopeptide (TPR) repeat protein
MWSTSTNWRLKRSSSNLNVQSSPGKFFESLTDTLNMEHSKKEIDRLITDFKLTEARHKLMSIDIEAIPPNDRSEYAQLCRRAGLFRLSLQFAHELIHESKNATQADLLEYAYGLRRVGLVSESLRLLDRRMPPSAKTSLQKAFCHIQRWDYGAAAGLLLLALEQHPNENDSRTARVNLAASLVVLGEYDAAAKWLSQLEPECRQHSFHHYLNCREIRAQIQVLRGDLTGAKTILNDSIISVGVGEGPAKLLLKKWQHIIAVAQGPREEARRAMADFKQQVRAAGHWESLRSIDWELARVTNDQELAAKVYFGTPFPAFRQQILSSPFGKNMPDHILRTDSRWSGQKPKLINGLTGQNMPFKFGSLPYRTALLMLSDNYQPWTFYRLFDGLFGDETFNPFSSPNRINQICDRIKTELKKDKIPLELRSSGQGFRLRPRDEGAVIVFDEMRFLSVEAMVLCLLKIRFKDQAFKLKDLNGLTPLSATQNSRAVRMLVQENALETISGDSKIHRYKVKAS